METLRPSENSAISPITKNYFLFFCLCLSVSLGLLVRVHYFILSDFPLNDGGLFKQMIDSIKLNHYILPDVVEYNRTEIPFAYPPLAFYLAAIVSDLLSLQILDVMRYMPLACNVLSIGVFVLLAAKLQNDKITVLYSSLIFPLIPRSYEWVIMGGGIARSSGFLFSLISAYQANRIPPTYNRKAFVWCSLFLCAATLCHLEWGITAFVAVSLIIFSRWSNRRGLCTVMALGAMVLVLTAPWWMTVVAKNGLTPFMNASKTSKWDLDRFVRKAVELEIFGSPGHASVWPVVAIGWISCIAKRKWFPSLWLIAIFLTTPRHAYTPSTVPLAMLSAEGLSQIGRYLMRLTESAARKSNRLGRFHSFVKHRSLSVPNYAIILAILVTVYMLLTTLDYVQQTPLIALTNDERSAMVWIKDSTPLESQFIVLSVPSSWSRDYVAEWFPVLSGRRSLVTAQGLEWMPDEAFERRTKDIKKLKHLQNSNPDGLAEYIESHYDSFQHIAVFMPDVESGYGGFAESGRYRVVYNNKSVLIFERARPGEKF
jgi:hypothetical protein